MPEPKRPLKVFLCHAHADRDPVHGLYARLTQDGVDAWLDKAKLLPGQDWELEIRRAVREADVVVVCLSKQFNQAGFRQKEVRLALDTAMEKPEGEIFIIPARLEECDNLESLRQWHWVDLFEDDGYEMLVRALRTRANIIGAELKSISVRKPPKLLITNPGRDNTKRINQEYQFRRRRNIQIIVALIGFIGTIAAALIGVYGNRGIFAAPSPTPMFSTPLVFTETTVPIIIPTGEVAIGDDWSAGCISTAWKAYPSTVQLSDRGDGCWREPVSVFSAENGDLDFLAERNGSGPVDVYGLFLPLPETGSVSVSIRLWDVSNADVLMGVYAEQDLNSPGLLMTITHGNAKQTQIIQKNNITDYISLQSTNVLNQGDGFRLTIKFDSQFITGIVNPDFTTNLVPIYSGRKWIFLGYKGFTGYYRIEGAFFDLILE